jgi:hypothetical protein
LPAATALSLPCAASGSIDLGGEWRQRYESAENPGFGVDGEHDSAWLRRMLLHADLHIGERWRAFAQLDHLAQHGRDDGATPTDADRIDVAQGYVEFTPQPGDNAATLRVGRQELAFGSSRLISVRNSPNARRSFDALRANVVLGPARVSLFRAAPVAIRPGRFDNRRVDGESLPGIYATVQQDENTGFDAYLLRLQRADAALADATGRERRYSAGVRPFGRVGPFDWDVEAVLQGGRLGDQRIRAWTVAIDAGWKLGHAWQPRAGLKLDIASGDGRAGDGRLGTFNALYPRLPYFSEAGLVAPANLIDLHPSVQVQPAPDLQISLGLDLIWRHRRSDAVYAPPLQPYPGSNDAAERFVTRQWIVDANWQPVPRWTFAAQWVRFQPGAALARDGAQAGRYLAASATWRF